LAGDGQAGGSPEGKEAKNGGGEGKNTHRDGDGGGGRVCFWS